MRPFAIALLIVAAAAPAAAQTPPRFDPLVFFAGRTEGAGHMRIMLGQSRSVTVHGRGRIDGDGALVLDQTVERPGKPREMRTWRIRPAGPNRYAGTLSDARGPVSGETIGDRLHLAYKGKGGVAIEQWLTLAPDGRSAQNVLTARKLGVVVAHLDETIRKVD